MRKRWVSNSSTSISSSGSGGFMSPRPRRVDENLNRDRCASVGAAPATGSGLMVWFERLRRRWSSDKPNSKAQRSGCHHRVLVACWENPADLGVESRATSYRCDGCGADFNPIHAYLLRLEAAHRLRSIGVERGADPGQFAGTRDRYGDRTFVRSLELAAVHFYGQQSGIVNQERSTPCGRLDAIGDYSRPPDSVWS